MLVTDFIECRWSAAGALARGIDDPQLLAIAVLVAEQLYKSYFLGFRWTPVVYGYLAATAGVVTAELASRAGCQPQ